VGGGDALITGEENRGGEEAREGEERCKL